MIQELLQKRELLCDIATELYGELWVTHDEFWDSPTELQMQEVEFQLFELGWTPPPPTPEELATGQILFDELIQKGIILEDPNFQDQIDDLLNNI